MSAPPSSGEKLAQIKEFNAQAAFLAAAAKPQAVEALSLAIATSDDPDFVRKAVETLDKISFSLEPKQTQVVFQKANFSIVLDDNVPQVAPPPREKRSVPIVDVEDAVEVSAAEPEQLPPPQEVQVHASQLDALADLLSITDE